MNTGQGSSCLTEEKCSKKRQYIAAITANLVTFSYGTYVGWPSSAIFQLQSENTPVGNVPISDEDASWIGSLLFIGFLCGTPIYSYISDKCGRKIAALLIVVPIIISWLLIIFGDTVYILFVARFLAGISTGGALLVTAIYVGEIAEESIRGTLGTYICIFGNSGTLFSYIVSAYVSYHVFAIICLIFPILFLVSFIWMPETPIYLLRKGDDKKAKESLKWLRGGHDEKLQEEITKMLLLLKKSQEEKSFKDLVKSILQNKGSRRALLIGIAVSLTQMFSGLFVVLSYTATIFSMTGSDISPQVSSIIVGSVLLAGAILACPLMDRAGRRILLITSELILGISLSILGIYLYLYESEYDLSSVSFLPVLCLGVYVFFLGVGLGPINMIILSEIFLPQVRSTAASVSTFMMALSAFIVTRFYNDLNVAIGIYGSYWFFAACCFLGTVFTIFYIPETKNRSVDSIHAELSGEQTSVLPMKKDYDMKNAPKKYKVQINVISMKL